ncbi:glycosyltransferase [Pararhodospirillum photometricum]|uniref:glycosyltransferase n=1 Tax=Pararhodospirillum photometricum TaxID=1084 RepID=UPI00031DE53E|nr:glycosyltransferase [Pararhodospirillum photometricum]
MIGATTGALSRLRRHLPGLSSGPEFVVTPWETDLPTPCCPEPSSPNKRWRIAIIGAVGQQKGYDILLACAEDAAARDLPLEFVLVGFSDDDARLVGTGRVFVTGRFGEAEALDLTQSQGATLALLPSISPETWCYALSVAWRAGLFVVAFDLGAIAERIREKGGGVLVSPDLGPGELNEVLVGILDGSSRGALGCVGSHQIPLSKDSVEGVSALFSFDHTHSTRNEPSMNSPLSSSDAPSPVQIQATPQVLSLAPGFYSLAVVEGGSQPNPGKIAVPSVQITTPPVSAPGTIVDLFGAHPGGWLTKAGDILIIRVTGPQAGTVILTSFKESDRPNENLRLQLNRLDETLQAAPSPAAQASPKAELLLHISRQGDRRFPLSSLAGVLGQQAWIEAFSLEAVENIRLDEIEYKGLTANGWETPWIPAGELCGNRGMGMPLIGFCFRLKGEAANRFDCVYEGAFASGRRTMPVTNGTPCRSDVIGDPLEGILLHLQPKAAASPAPRVL